MESVAAFWNECVRCPVTLSIISVLIAVWAVTYKQNLSSSGGALKPFLLSYEAVFTRGELWRCFTAPWLHFPLTHLLLDVVCLWSLRFLEYDASDFTGQKHPPAQLLLGRGSRYYLTYSLVLATACAALSLLQVGLVRWRLLVAAHDGGGLSATPAVPRAMVRVFGELALLGYTPVVLAWSMVVSLAAAPLEAQAAAAGESTGLHYSVLGLFAVSYSFMPLVLFLAAYVLVPRLTPDAGGGGAGNFHEGAAATQMYNGSGILAGLLLSGDVLAVCPSVYWTVCMAANAAAAVAFARWLATAQQRGRRQVAAQDEAGPDIEAGEAARAPGAWVRFAVTEAGETSLLYLRALPAAARLPPLAMEGLGGADSDADAGAAVEMTAGIGGSAEQRRQQGSSWLGQPWFGGASGGEDAGPDEDREDTGLLAGHGGGSSSSGGGSSGGGPRARLSRGGSQNSLMLEAEDSDGD
jgi:uncharacterized membrane protein YgcG